MIRATRTIVRLFAIARVLARHDALFLLERVSVAREVAAVARLVWRAREEGRPGERLARALSELGPTFIKLGQALSTRPDLVGEQTAADLSRLQDRLDPFPGDEARRIVSEELGHPLGDLFSRFDDHAVAAASIAQVHFAETADGREVAVKVLRPGIEEAFSRDLDMLYWLAEMVELTQPSLRRLKPVETVRTFEDTVNMEMDLRFEAAAAAELAENFAGDESFQVPEVDWMRTAQRVLTTERVSGVAVDERDALIQAGIEPREVVAKSAAAMFNMVFRDGFFHGDMHPGNLFVDSQGNLIAVDFGIMGRVDKRTRRYLGEMLLGFLNGDYRRVAEVHFEAGYVPHDKSVDAFTQAARSIGEPIMGKPLNEISIARLLGQLFQVTETFGMETQPQLLLLQKTMLTAEGVGRALAPEVNMWELARPLVEDWMRDTIGPEARLRETMAGAVAGLERLPRILADAEKATATFNDLGLRLHPETVRLLSGPGRRGIGLGALLPWLVVAILVLYLFF